MNKKNKNKNRNKPTNPAPLPLKTELAENVEEDKTGLSEEKPVSFIKESDNIVETTSEAIEPVFENEETPKKPKRNKGKKKKQEETTLDENRSVATEDSTTVPPPILDSDVKVKNESLTDIPKININLQEESKDTEENVTANVRKKKNKKKQHEEQKMEEPIEEIGITYKMQADSSKGEKILEKTNLDVTAPEIIESENKQSKKKNKKKKHRNDSEKSEKAEEVVVCTAEFQKLISSTENEGDMSAETNIESSTNVTTSDERETLKELIQSVLVPEETNQFQNEPLQHDEQNEPKGKKKSKKDKKQQHSTKNSEKNNLMQEEITQQEKIMESVNIVQDLVQESSMEQVESESKDTVSKTKAKIAKPVEKKRKGKAEIYEVHKNKAVEDIVSSDVDAKEPGPEMKNRPESLNVSNTPQDKNVQNIVETQKIEIKSDNEVTDTITEQSCVTLTSTDIPNSPNEARIEDKKLEVVDVNIGIKSNEAIAMSSVMIQDPITSEPETDLEHKNIEPTCSLKVHSEKGNSSTSSEPYKTVEKKKKKHSKKIDVSGEKTFDNKDLITSQTDLTTKETTLEKTEDSSLPALSPNIDNTLEISSLKTDEPDELPDAIPDFINHPLAISQQLVDNNNNTIIREITPTEEKLNLRLMVNTEPIIRNSGETPEPAGEHIIEPSPSLIIAKERSPGNEPEKTDLKSKMMEVSQDMEELRLSIERSLAELTSMEKSEEDVEKRYETSEIKSCDVADNEKSKSVPENILSDISLQEVHSTNPKEITMEKTDSKIQEQEILQLPEKIQEKQDIIPVAEKLDEQIHVDVNVAPPQAPARKDNKSRGKGKRKGKQEIQSLPTPTLSQTTNVTPSENISKEVKKQEKEQQEQKSQSSESNENKGKQQQSMQLENSSHGSAQLSTNDDSKTVDLCFEPIEHFEDALTSSVDDLNKTFEMIANEVNNTPECTFQNPEINITSSIEDKEAAEPKQNPVSPPKNLLGHPDIPVPSNRTDYKKERNKPPNMRQAKVKIKDAVDVERTEKTKQSKESQTENKKKIANTKNVLESFSYMTNENAEYIYKYSFRKVFLQSLCNVCRKKLEQRVPCQFCSLVFYCSQKHKDEDWPQHQSLCFAICTITHLKGQKYIYADAKNITGQSYRVLRMQTIISCEKVLKRKLVPWEQEALLYPRMCADVTCREWKQSKLTDCEGCEQISYCSENPMHLPASHQQWCKSYSLYQKLVHHQQTKGRLEPKLPSGVVADGFKIPEKINEILAAMYNEKIDMTDIEYAALTQLGTAPLTAAYSHQLATANHSNGISKKKSFVVHIVGAELQFEADVLFKWELFFLHLKPQIQELRVVLIGVDLNPSNLPLNLLGKVNLCESCRSAERRVIFSFQDKKNYYEYWASDDFLAPDIVCAFNPSIQRSSMYNGKDTWPTTIGCIIKLKTPFIISSYSIDELNRDITRVKEISKLSGVSFKTISEPKCNPFASVRPDRNFITDDETPLLFKNYCFVILCGV